MDMIAERVKKTRDETFNEFVTVKDAEGKEVQKRANHTTAIFSPAAPPWITNGTMCMPS